MDWKKQLEEMTKGMIESPLRFDDLLIRTTCYVIECSEMIQVKKIEWQSSGYSMYYNARKLGGLGGKTLIGDDTLYNVVAPRQDKLEEDWLRMQLDLLQTQEDASIYE